MADVPIPRCQPCYRHCRCPLLHLGFGAAEAVFGSTSLLGAEQRNQGDSKWPVPTKPSHGGPAVPVWPDPGGAVGLRTLRAWTRRDSLEELNRRTTPSAGRHHFLPPGWLTPLIGPRGTASLLAGFPLGPGASFGGGGEWVHFKRRASPSPSSKEVARASGSPAPKHPAPAMRCDGRPLGMLAGRCLPASRNYPLARAPAVPSRRGAAGGSAAAAAGPRGG